MDKFWCCYVEGTGGFGYRHLFPESAMVEAERLARLKNNEGKKVYVLSVVAQCHTASPPIEWDK